MSIVASSPANSQGNLSNRPGTPFDRAFQKPWQARKAGYQSKTAWDRVGRKLKADQIPSLVVLASGFTDCLCGWEYVLEDRGDGFYRTAHDCYRVYRLDQTVPKPTRKAKTASPARELAFYVPVTFDSKQFPEDQRDLVHYFLNLLHWKWLCWQADEGTGFVRLKHDYLTKIIPRACWLEIRDRLVELGVIEWDKSYRRNTKSFGFKLAPDYRKTRRVVCADDCLNRRVQKVYSQDQLSLLPVHDWLEEKLSLLDFDMPLAHSIIQTMHPDRKSSAMTDEEFRLLLTESCQKFVVGDLPLTVDKYGRVHTPVTSLSKELRRCLVVDGQNLVGLDLANSQPLIAGICAKQFYKSRMSRSRLLKKAFENDNNPYCYRELQEMGKLAEELIEINQYPTQSISHGTPTNFPPLLRITTEEKSQPPYGKDTYESAQVLHSAVKPAKYADLDDYIRLCEQGQFYESLMEPGEDRHAFKEKFYGDVFFGKTCFRSRLKSRFEARFPSIAGMLREVKKQNYRHSSWLMQNYEATIFIYTICNRIRAERPDVPIFTIHDSLLTVRDEVEYVESIIMDEFRKLGIRPTLKREDYNASKQYPRTSVA